jgi:hypothetical protein
MSILRMLNELHEGRAKEYMANKIAGICTCDGQESLDPADHDPKCPAYKKLQDGDYGSDDIDAAEYRFGKDR